MAERILKPISSDANSITFADPNDVRNTTRFSVATSNSTLPSGVKVGVVRSETIANRTISVQKAGCTGCENAADMILSLRIKATTIANEQLSEQMVNDAFENARRAFLAGIGNGFKPLPSESFVIDKTVTP